MPYPHWSPKADALFDWVAGGVWCNEQQRCKKWNIVFIKTHVYEGITDFLDAFNKFNPFDENKKEFTFGIIRRHATKKMIQLQKCEWIERPPWLSEDVLKGQFGEVGLKDLHESTSRLRRAAGSDTAQWREKVQKHELNLQKSESVAAQYRDFFQRKEEAERLEACREQEEKLRELQFRNGVKERGFTKDDESSGGLSWTDPNASGFHLQTPEFDSHDGAFRPGVKDRCLTPSLQLETTSTVRR
ncbi:uncharacterized protein EAF01_003688 [Botrytis porri]|uniref:Uncharacterized protein n=1 Tax=Botrytis porri TaxID=87229 RepID=A0A4Z1KAK6_9HELO|nr:uncharacterized protein EAF01_003688 [Botrytis porri]KAF7909970.1 hypothetical protein EAF01_003688 [Botrytis porri]TGO82436.1 hypothetical protein BPOR_0832g00060 [Botrytis porri]